MSIIDFPRDMEPFTVSTFDMWAVHNVWRARATISKAVKTRSLGGGFWMCSFTLRAASWRERAKQAAFVESLEGGANRLRMWHLARPRPYGTITGTPSVQAAANAGARSITLLTDPGVTLEMGDLFGVGGQLLRAASRARSSGAGVMTVALTRPMRADVLIGAAVTLERPSALWVLATDDDVRTDTYRLGYSPEIELTFQETDE